MLLMQQSLLLWPHYCSQQPEPSSGILELPQKLGHLKEEFGIPIVITFSAIYDT